MPLHPWRTHMSIVAGSLILGVVPALFAADEAKPPASPLSPQEARNLFRIDPGLTIELVAAEPDIVDPVEIAFDEQGRLWVVEMRDYPNGPEPGAAPSGRIKVLEDTDGDGRYERVRVFADGLLFANGILPWKQGVVVTSAPEILFLKDGDGDGRADQREPLYRGFTAGNPQLRVSHPTLGIDNWVYVANGLRGGQVVRVGQESQKPIELGGMDFRFDLIHDRAEAISGMGQYGLTFDAWGNRFVCDNRHHLRHIVFPNQYARRNPFLAVPDVVEDISTLGDGPLSSGGRIYPISRNWTTSSLHAGHFTAACGVHVYGGDLLPEPYPGAAFTCDPTGNLVHMEILAPNGATFRSRPAREGVEFLATTDTWFRPVNLTSGPDGALYVVDMYRSVIEHPEFMPAELKNRPDLMLGRDRGRIWRIRPEGKDVPSRRPRLDPNDREGLVARLGHPDSWTRRTAQRLLLERLDEADLRRLKEEPTPPSRIWVHGSILRAWLLETAGALDDEALRTLLVAEDHPRLVEQAVKIAEPRLASREELREQVIRLARHPDPKVRFQVALSLGAWDNDAILEPLAVIALEGAADHWTRLAVESAVPERAGKLIGVLLGPTGGLTARPEAGRLALLSELAFLVGARNEAEEIRAALGSILGITGTEANRWRFTGLNGLADGMARKGTGLAAVLARLDQSKTPEDRALAGKVNELLNEAATLSADSVRSVDERTAAIRLLAIAPWDQARSTLAPLLGSDPLQEVRLAAARAIAAHREADVPKALISSWNSATPAVRREVVGLLIRQGDRAQFLLDRLEAGEVRPGDLDATQVRQLVNSGNLGIRERSRKLLQASLPKERQEVLSRYQRAVSLAGQADRGREVFGKNCATCHRVAGVGVDVGPDIGDTRTKSKDALLGDILNPNQAIDANFVAYVVATKDGAVLDGVIAAETASSITLKRAEGKTDILLRKDIDDLRSTGQSLMPEGLEKNISVEEMADLLTFLKDWRYLEGDVPAGISGR